MTDAETKEGLKWLKERGVITSRRLSFEIIDKETG